MGILFSSVTASVPTFEETALHYDLLTRKCNDFIFFMESKNISVNAEFINALEFSVDKHRITLMVTPENKFLYFFDGIYQFTKSKISFFFARQGVTFRADKEDQIYIGKFELKAVEIPLYRSKYNGIKLIA